MRDVVAMLRRVVDVRQSAMFGTCGVLGKLVGALAIVGGVACGSSGDSGTGVKSAAHDSLTFGADTIVVAPGRIVPLNLRRGGAAVPPSDYTWTTSQVVVAQVTGDGRILATVPGKAVITGVGIGVTGSVVVNVTENLQLSDFRPPLTKSVSTTTVFDHDLPIGFSDANNYSLSYWGEHLVTPDLGHNGYDWPIPEGTPVLAAAPGAVVNATADAPAACPLLNGKIVSANDVVIAHGLADGSAVETQYLHLSRIDVVYGQRVETGQQIGLSGTTGCSTGPHLHFTVAFGVPVVGRTPTPFDPYGWQGPSADPWAVDGRGVASKTLWPSASFPIYGELKLVGVFAVPSPVVMTLVRYMGIDDAHNLNNEYIDLAANPSFGDADLSGLSVRNATGNSFTFPSGERLAVGTSLRVFTGAGANTPTELHMGRTQPMMNDDIDCLELVRGDTVLFNSQWGGGGGLCVGLSAASVTAPPVARDVSLPASIDALRGQTRAIRTP